MTNHFLEENLAKKIIDCIENAQSVKKPRQWRGFLL